MGKTHGSTKLSETIAPEDILKSFELIEIKDGGSCNELYFEEKEALIPQELKGVDVVLDGFCNPLSLLSFPLKGKPT